MLGLLGIVRLAALRELRGGGGLLFTAAAVLIAAAALTALPIVYQTTAADAALRSWIEQSPRAVEFGIHDRAGRPLEAADFSAVDADAARVRGAHLSAFEGLIGESRRMSFTAQAPSRYTRTDNGLVERLPAYLHSFEEIREYSRLTAGAWPDPDVSEGERIPVVIGAELGAQIGLDVGSVVSWPGSPWPKGMPDRLQFEVVGLIEPLADDLLVFHGTDVWFSLQRDVGIGGDELLYYALIIDQGLLLEWGGRLGDAARAFPVQHTIRTRLQPQTLNSDQVNGALAAIENYLQELRQLEGGSAAVFLGTALGEYQRREAFSGGQSLIAGLQIVAVALFAVALVGRRVAARSRADRERLAARGAQPWQQAAAQAALGFWIAVPAAVLGAPLAAFGLHYAGYLSAVERVSGGEAFDTRLTEEAWLLALAGALAAWLAFAAPAWLEARSRAVQVEHRAQQRRAPTPSIIHRAWLDVGLLVTGGDSVHAVPHGIDRGRAGGV